MSLLVMLLIGLLAVAATVITSILMVVVYAGIIALMVGGSTVAPALTFALLFTMGKSSNLIVSILIFAISFYAAKKLMQYRKVKIAMMANLAVTASAISAYAVQIVCSFFSVKIPALISLAIMIGIMIFTLNPVILTDEEEKKGYPISTRIIASILHGSAINTFFAAFALILNIKSSGLPAILSYALWAIFSVVAYFVDMKLEENDDFMNRIRELPILKAIKGKFDKVIEYMLNKLKKWTAT